MNPQERSGEGRGREGKTIPPQAAVIPLVRMGVGASRGMASGPAHLVIPHEQEALVEPALAPGAEKQEARRFRLALRRATDELVALRECILGEPEDAGIKILDAHRMLLDDPEFQRKVQDGIRTQHLSAEAAVTQVFEEMVAVFDAARSEYFRGRAADVRDVRRRLLKHLQGNVPAVSTVPEGAVVVAYELSPSESTSFDPAAVRALVTDHGGPTSHAAILARSRGIPAVVGLGDLSSQVEEGDFVLVDGHRGIVVVRPDREQIREFEQKRREEERRAKLLADRDAGPPVTRDGFAITLLANIEVPEDTPTVLKVEAQGVGLYRTEFFYLKGHALPDEDGQYRAYRSILQKLRPRPVTIRTLDAGGDKFAAYLGTTRENNPFLGLRGIRFSLSHPDVFRIQIRAILRAAVHGNARILFPMISSLEEMRAANQLVDASLAELRHDGVPVPEKIERGAMIEVPAAVILADLLAREVDFFSIGSNDLIQYTLAVDRENERLAYLYDPMHPAVLRSLAATIDAANRARIPVSSCGEMSGSPYGAAVLIGLGCSNLSMSPYQVPEVRDLVRQVSLVDLRRLTESLLRLATVEEVHATLKEALGDLLESGPRAGRGASAKSTSPREGGGGGSAE